MAECRNGHTVHEGYGFCPECGERVSADRQESADTASAASTCGQGHAVPSGYAFCPQCGSPTGTSGPPAVTRPPGQGRRSLPAGVAVLAVVALAGLGWWLMAASGHDGPLAASTQTIDGSITLTDADGYTADYAGCSGEGGYSDMDYGTEVTVRDGKGELLATSELGLGEEDDYGCAFAFTVEDVPDADFYEIEVSHRGALSYSLQEMEDNAWSVEFSLGD